MDADDVHVDLFDAELKGWGFGRQDVLMCARILKEGILPQGAGAQIHSSSWLPYPSRHRTNTSTTTTATTMMGVIKKCDGDDEVGNDMDDVIVDLVDDEFENGLEDFSY